MWLYLIIFIIPVIAYWIGSADNRNKTFLMCYMGSLALFVGLSDMFGGYDRYIYGVIFDSIANGVTYGYTYGTIMDLTYFEVGYSVLSYLIALITENRYIYIFIITIIIYICIYKSFERYMLNYPLAMIIFLGMVFFFTFTYLRQVLAFSVAWYGAKYLIDGKKWKFFVIVLVVTLLHKSGVIFACLYFIPNKKWKPQIIVFILCICCVVGFLGITRSLYELFTNVSENEDLDGYFVDSGARLAYLIEVLFFVWLILSNYSKIESKRSNLIFLNMSWAFCGLLLLFIRSNDGGRVAWFFTIGIVYTITLIGTTSTAHRKIKNSIGYLMICVMLTLYLRIYNSWQAYNNLYPYKTFLTNGYRYPDYSWEKYEYDHRYDTDKFYRPAFRFLK